MNHCTGNRGTLSEKTIGTPIKQTSTMEIIIKILVGLIAAIHCYILWFEMFAWETKGKKTFTRFPSDLFAKTKEMAANQGIYNGFIAAGLI